MLRFYIPNMPCGGCAKSVTEALLGVDRQARIEADQPRLRGEGLQSRGRMRIPRSAERGRIPGQAVRLTTRGKNITNL